KGQDFDLYSDTRDQVYGGVVSESQAASDAITATKSQVVLWNGKVADTLFFSTSGGRTNSALDATGSAVPYLVPVADPVDTLSPYPDCGRGLLSSVPQKNGRRLARVQTTPTQSAASRER